MVTDSMSSMFEPLNDREREILALLSENLSDREIAARLHLSPTTVKWYNKGIYQKLGVESRKQAADRARVLGLLASTEQPPAAPHNLPSQLTPFVGRIGELEEIGRWITDPSSRLLTLTAPGGMGKSRLALAAAYHALHVFQDGVFFVPLAPVGRPEDVVEAVIVSAGVPRMQDGRPPVQQACDFFAHKHVLLVLDNFEHLLDAADLVTTLLQAAPHLKVVVTSRERLNLSAETVYTLTGLHYPAEAASHDLSEYGAVQLFMQSALRADPRFAASTAEVASVCRLVQGMPLAIELAAAWVSAMTPAEIAGEIERSADFLSTTARDVPERLRSVRAVFETTWARLPELEHRTFAAMSVFRGGCTQEAALTVTDSTKPVIAALIGKALIWRDAQTGRLSVHELLRQYAESVLIESGTAGQVRDAHRLYYAAYTEKWAIALRTDETNALAHLDAEYSNIATAFESAIDVATPEALLPFTDTWNYYTIRGLLHEGARVLDAAIAAIDGPDSLALGKLLGARSELAGYLGQDSREDETATRCLTMIKRIGAREVLPFAHMMYGNGPLRSDPEGRFANYSEGYAVAEELGDLWGTLVLAYLIGWSLMDLGRGAEAQPWFEESHERALRLRSMWALAHTYFALAGLAFEADDFDLARQMYEESLLASKRLNYAMRMLWANLGLNSCAMMTGDFQLAKQYTLEGLRIAHFTGGARENALASLRVADCCCELGEFAQAIDYLKRSATYSVEDELTKIERMFVGGSILLRTGHYRESVHVVSYISQWRRYTDIIRMDHLRIQANLRTLRRSLGEAALERAADEVAGRSIDDMHAMMYAMLERYRAVGAAGVEVNA